LGAALKKMVRAVTNAWEALDEKSEKNGMSSLMRKKPAGEAGRRTLTRGEVEAALDRRATHFIGFQGMERPDSSPKLTTLLVPLTRNATRVALSY
jgi:hypothetical protein